LSVPALLRTPLDENATRIVRRLQNSGARMAGLIDNILDFAHARMGSGLSLTRIVDPGLEGMLNKVIAELQTVWPERVIQKQIALRRSVICDRVRIAQLFSNLLANALTHGALDRPVRVQACSDDSGFEISVINGGEPIPHDFLDRLFEPFSRASAQSGQQGLGLGLYIASEIARAHEGSTIVASSSEETCFTFRMPISPGNKSQSAS
jgi:signal transduction histidine kinase